VLLALSVGSLRHFSLNYVHSPGLLFSSFVFSRTSYFMKFLSIVDLLTYGLVLLALYAGSWRKFSLNFVHRIDPF
jgi:hypothetical protein